MPKPRFIVDHVEFEPKRAFRPLCPAHKGEWKIYKVTPKDDNHVTVIWVEVVPSLIR
jgi:hypothetical protein